MEIEFLIGFELKLGLNLSWKLRLCFKLCFLDSMSSTTTTSSGSGKRKSRRKLPQIYIAAEKIGAILRISRRGEIVLQLMSYPF